MNYPRMHCNATLCLSENYMLDGMLPDSDWRPHKIRAGVPISWSSRPNILERSVETEFLFEWISVRVDLQSTRSEYQHF